MDGRLWCFLRSEAFGCVSRKMQGRSLAVLVYYLGLCVEMFSLKKRTSSFPQYLHTRFEPHPQAPVTEGLVF